MSASVSSTVTVHPDSVLPKPFSSNEPLRRRFCSTTTAPAGEDPTEVTIAVVVRPPRIRTLRISRREYTDGQTNISDDWGPHRSTKGRICIAMTSRRNEPPICIDCGLCCDGTLFHAIDTDSDDDLTPLRNRGALLVSDSESRRFLQPCPAFDGSCCSVYEDRPTACRVFACALLENVADGRTRVSDAKVTIARARRLAAVVRNTLEPPATADTVELGRPGLSTYLGIMVNQYERERLDEVFPEALELIELLQTDFGWTNRVAPEGQIDSGK